MSTTQYDSRTAAKFVVRLPEGLREEVEVLARFDDRSMNSVIVQAIRNHLAGNERQELLLSALAEAVNTIAEKPSTASESMNIDDRVRMAANARRYEWLRDLGRVADAEDTVVACRGHHYLYSDDLDKEIDDAMRLANLQELHSCAD